MRIIYLRTFFAFLLILLTCAQCVFAEIEIEYIMSIENPHPEDHGWFGSRLARDGDLMVVAAWGAEVEGMREVGRAYIYDIDGNLKAELESTRARIPFH